MIHPIKLKKFYIIEDCEIQSGDNIIADDNSYTSDLHKAMLFNSYDEAQQFIYDVNPYYDAIVKELYEVAFGIDIRYFYYQDFKQFLIDLANEI